MKTLIFLAALFYACPAVCAEFNLESHQNGIWSIAATPQANRWLIIHNLSEAKSSGVYHIEVIVRNKNAPAWQINHAVNHMAISEPALLASIIKPLKSGGVYPESFDSAYKKWQMENSGKGGAVCTTTVIECIRQTGPM